MSNQMTADEMFAAKILRSLYRDLCSAQAKNLCNTLDRALRRRDTQLFNTTCSSLAAVVREDREPWEIKEALQVISLIRFPLWKLSADDCVRAQRSRVESLTWQLSPSDKIIWEEAGSRFCEIVRTAIRNLSLEGFRHGPGVVCETSSALKKRQVCYIDPRIQRRFGQFIPDLVQPILRAGFSRTIVVPKDHKTLRVIASEPTWTQWCQQGVKEALYKCIPRHPLFRGHISFTDQGLQRRLLRQPEMATIDLSDASDTLRSKHLLLLTKGDLAVREFLMDLRTHMTDWNGDRLPTIGLYPMGAAVCFPIETLVFSLLAIGHASAEGCKRLRWGVFGDDIIIDRAYGGGLCRFLERSGFKPNRSKTFLSGAFTESCGVMLYKGIDVTPVKIKKGPPVGLLDVANVTYVDLVSQLAAYPHLRRTVAEHIVNHRMRSGTTRWNPDFQRLEVATLNLSVSAIKGNPFGYPEALIRGKCDIPQDTHRACIGWRPLV